MIKASELFKDFVSDLSGLYDKSEASSIANIVFKEKLGLRRTDIALNPELMISRSGKDKIARISKKLLEGFPIQHLLGYADFYGLKLKVNKNVLIPRQETEELVRWVINENKKQRRLKVLDIGTGSGCIVIALAKGLHNPDVTGVDISTKALELARVNAGSNEVTVNFKKIDILNDKTAGKLGEFDVIVSNPPYVTEKEKALMHVNVLDHDPHLALFVPDTDPLIFYKKIADMALKHLSPGGQLYFEINEAYGAEIKNMLESKGFKDVLIRKDMNGKDRFVRGIFSSNP